MMETVSTKKRRKMERLKRIRKSNPKYQKKILYPKTGDSVLVVMKIHLDSILRGIKTLECRSKACRNLKIGDPLFFQEKNRSGTIRGYVTFQGLVEFKSERQFQDLVESHRVYNTTLEETGYKFGWILSSPHQYDEEIIVDSRGQQRKRVYKVFR